MKEKLLSWLEKSLVALLLCCFALPLLTAAWLRYYPHANELPPAPWLRNATLGGVQIPPEPVPYSRAALFNAKLQDALAHNYNFHFAGRELLIRLTNELYVRLFHAAIPEVLIGPGGSLSGRDYAVEYCFARGSREVLAPLVERLRRMQDACDARGVAFTFLITPSKASVCPEELPTDWQRRVRPEPRFYDLLLSMLQEKGVRHVDGHQLTVAAKAGAPVPVFPLGGLHWGQPAALVTANALLASLAGRGLPVEPVSRYRIALSDEPQGQDKDIVVLLNVALPRRYPVGEVIVEPLPLGAGRRPNVVVVGGSFLWNLLTELNASRQFGETELYFYYKLSKNCGVGDAWRQVEAPTAPVNFATDVFAADALVLEANEEVLFAGANHLRLFIDDALASLPDPQVARAPFHSESRMTYRWGATLPFVSGGPDAVKEFALTSFMPVTVNGTYTLGPRADVRLDTPPPPAGDAILEIEASAFLAEGKLPEQRVRVLVNGHDVGEWVWQSTVPGAHRETRVPGAFLGGGGVEITFQIAHPCSPAAYGVNPDTHPYGICLTSLRLRPAGD